MTAIDAHNGYLIKLVERMAAQHEIDTALIRKGEQFTMRLVEGLRQAEAENRMLKAQLEVNERARAA